MVIDLHPAIAIAILAIVAFYVNRVTSVRQ